MVCWRRRDPWQEASRNLDFGSVQPGYASQPPVQPGLGVKQSLGKGVPKKEVIDLVTSDSSDGGEVSIIWHNIDADRAAIEGDMILRLEISGH